MRWFVIPLVTLIVSWLAAPAAAQTATRYVSASVGAAQVYDDEGRIGTGLDLGAGVGWALTNHLGVELTAGRTAHERRTSFLSWDGRLTTGQVRLAWRFRDRSRRVRPLVAGGLGWGRWTGELTVREQDPRAPHQPGPAVRHPWNFWGPVWEAGAGLEIGAGRGFLRPEVTVGSAHLDKRAPTSVPSPTPVLLSGRVGVAAGWRF